MVPMNAMFTFYSFINLYAMTGELFTVGSWRIAHYTGKKAGICRIHSFYSEIDQSIIGHHMQFFVLL